MVHINFARREVNCKIVYYGPGLSGKTTNLEIVHTKAPDDRKGQLTSIATEGDRTLFFDYMPLDLGKVGGMTTKFLLYTVPGQIYYDSTRKLVLEGADGVVFVADSQANKLADNIESLKNPEKNLSENGLDIRELPLVIQWNKRDIPGALSLEELEAKLNWLRVPTTEAVAVSGQGVMQTLKKLSEMVLAKVNSELGSVGSGQRRSGLGAGAPPTARPPSVGAPAASPPVAAPPRPAVRPASTAQPSLGAPPRPAPPPMARPLAPSGGVAAARPGPPPVRPPAPIAGQVPARPPAPPVAPPAAAPARSASGGSKVFLGVVIGIVVLVAAIVGAYVAMGL